MFILPPLPTGAAPAPSLNRPRAQRRPRKRRDTGGATGCERCVLGTSSQAGSARGSRLAAVPCGSGGRGRGVPLLFCDRSNGGTGCLGNCNVVNQPVQDLSLSRESASCGKIQAHPRPLVNNGPGPFHCPERRSFHFTNGFVSCCSRRISI